MIICSSLNFPYSATKNLSECQGMYLPAGQWQQAEEHEEYNAVITIYGFVGISD